MTDIDEATTLMTSQALSMFSTAYYRLLMECNRRGDRDLTGTSEDSIWLQTLYKFTDAVLQQKFGSEEIPTVHTELARVLPYAAFTMADAATMQGQSKESYETSMLKLGGLVAAQHIPPLAKKASCLTPHPPKKRVCPATRNLSRVQLGEGP